MRSLIVSLVLFLTSSSSYAFTSSRWTTSRQVAVAATNRLDGIDINGDLLPLSNNVFVKVKEALSETKGGLFIPDNAKERPTDGMVVAVGPGRIHPETGVLMTMAVEVGDNVIYGKYDGTEMKYNDLNYQLIKDDDILLKYKGNKFAILLFALLVVFYIRYNYFFSSQVTIIYISVCVVK